MTWAHANSDAVRGEQRSSDVPRHGDGATTGGLGAESTDGGVRDGGLSEFAAHEDHLTCRNNGTVVGHVVGEHLVAGINIGRGVRKENPLAGTVDVPQRGGFNVLGHDDRDGLVEHVAGRVGGAWRVVQGSHGSIGTGEAFELNGVVGGGIGVREGRDVELRLTVVVKAVLDFNAGIAGGSSHGSVPDEHVNFLGHLTQVAVSDDHGDGGVADEVREHRRGTHGGAFCLRS